MAISEDLCSLQEIATPVCALARNDAELLSA